MSNRVFLNNENLIEVDVIGDQNMATVELMGRQIDTLIAELRAIGKPVLILDNLLQIGKVDAEARKLVVELAKRLNYDRTAMLGRGGLMRFGTNLMLRATGRGDTVRFFDNRNQAVTWLQGQQPA